MSFERFINQAVSPWMRLEGPDSDIVMSSRIRLARNFKEITFPTFSNNDEANQIISSIEKMTIQDPLACLGEYELLKMDELQPLQKLVLVEKHLISPHLAEDSRHGACLVVRK